MSSPEEEGNPSPAQLPALVLKTLYALEQEGHIAAQSGDIAQTLELDPPRVDHAVRRLLERGHIRSLGFRGPGEFAVSITEAGRQAVEASEQSPIHSFKQEVHGTANTQVGNHNTLNYYALTTDETFTPPGLPATPHLATPQIRFTAQQLGRWHLALYMANLNPYILLLESLRFGERVLDLRAFEWAAPAEVQERLEPTARTYLATLDHPQINRPPTTLLPGGQWQFAVRFVTTEKPEVFEARVICQSQLGASWEDRGTLEIVATEVVAL